MWKQAVRKDANSLCVSDFMESRIFQCSVIFIPITYFSLQNVCEVFCSKGVTEDSIIECKNLLIGFNRHRMYVIEMREDDVGHSCCFNYTEFPELLNNFNPTKLTVQSHS
jgi:hypothetical protein